MPWEHSQGLMGEEDGLLEAEVEAERKSSFQQIVGMKY
jgi:hypothetical protein